MHFRSRVAHVSGIVLRPELHGGMQHRIWPFVMKTLLEVNPDTTRRLPTGYTMQDKLHRTKGDGKTLQSSSIIVTYSDQQTAN